MFVANGARPVVTRPALRLMTVSRFLFVGLEPIRSFPAKLFAERTTQIAQTIIGRRETQVATREALFAGIMDVVILGIGLNRTRRSVILTVVVGAEAAHIQPPHVPFGVTVDDPLCHHLANATRARQPMRAE